MQIWRQTEARRVRPPGHYGDLELADIVPRDLGGNFTVQTSYCPPGGGGEMHSHADDAQLFLVVQGELSFDTGEQHFTLHPMEAVLFEPNEPHATRNNGSGNSVSVVVTVRR